MEIKYYYDEEHDILSAYNRETEFFAQFSAERKWVRSKISFMQFKHDYNYKLITAEQAAAMTDGVLADDALNDYVAVIKANRGEI